MQVEACLQLGLPLLNQVRRAQHGQAGDLTSVHQLPRNQPGFDGLADANVIGNEQPNGGQAQGHQQGYELVATGLHGDVAE